MNFQYLEKRKKLMSEEAEQSPDKKNPNNSILRHIRIKFVKNKHKETSLKAARDKWGLTYRRVMIWMTEDLSSETMEARMNGTTFLKCWKKELSTQSFISRKNIL